MSTFLFFLPKIFIKPGYAPSISNYLFFTAELTSFFTLSHSGPQWQYFASVDLLVELTKCLLSSKVTSAVIIWRRHQVKWSWSVSKSQSSVGKWFITYDWIWCEILFSSIFWNRETQDKLFHANFLMRLSKRHSWSLNRGEITVIEG